MVFFTGRAPTFGEVAIATQELIRMVLLKARVNSHLEMVTLMRDLSSGVCLTEWGHGCTPTGTLTRASSLMGKPMAAGYLSLLVMEMLGLPIAMKGNILEMNLMDRAQSGVVLPPSIIPLIIS
jgi:hypothetical protein